MNRAEESKNFYTLFAPHFDEVIEFSDAKAIGLSVILPYPSKGLLFRPAKNQEGLVDSVMMFKIYYDPSSDSDPVNAQVSVSKASKYLLKNPNVFFPEETDLGYPTKEERLKSERSTQPADLFSTPNECTFDRGSNVFFFKGKEVSAKVVVEKFTSKHINTARILKGARYRATRFAFKKPQSLFSFLYKIGDYLIEKIWGRKIKEVEGIESVWIKHGHKSVSRSDLELKAITTINLFGHAIILSKPLLIFTSLGLVASYILWVTTGLFSVIADDFIRLTTNPLLLPALIISYFWFTDSILLSIVIILRNASAYLMRYFQNRKIKI